MHAFFYYARHCYQSWLKVAPHRASAPRWMNLKIGMIPLPIFSLIGFCLIALVTLGKVPSEISVVLPIMAVLSVGCAEMGKHLPLLRHMGGPVIVTVLLPSYFVYSELMPTELVGSISDFWHATNILYLFTVAVVVGGILSMDRHILIKGFVKLFIPLAAGSIASAIIGTLTAWHWG
ncbi:Citrate/L-malate proton symporter [Mycoavidus cysteinexigens]|uniref:Citrate/L-malate proton symporter n=1 Tax=Mycoavidus cysteinexigens TaxID=1553431 RepID=A0A2Z6EWM3_9BURK|nr:Citrate/L-malate proton symporter [Mycoavidus cysteinexigens]GAM53841.1 hypothetical protein EBME_2304 [bacterium endosymbiont of Mortierella elongata FMR23-6]GLR01717.1 hypothetical protein GCM10007934_15290 [Mycoavidus cysteinexigens]